MDRGGFRTAATSKMECFGLDLGCCSSPRSASDGICILALLFRFTNTVARGGSRTAATFKMEHFVIIVNGWKPLTIITKCSILVVAAVLDLPLVSCGIRIHEHIRTEM